MLSRLACSEPEISRMSEKTRYRHHGWHAPLEVLAYVVAVIILLSALGYLVWRAA